MENSFIMTVNREPFLLVKEFYVCCFCPLSIVEEFPFFVVPILLISACKMITFLFIHVQWNLLLF